MTEYPLYDVPYLVREANDSWMSQKRHEIEVRNQAIVDDYFVARDRGLTEAEARKHVAQKYQLSLLRVHYIFVWFYKEAKKRGKWNTLVGFDSIFALEIEN